MPSGGRRDVEKCSSRTPGTEGLRRNPCNSELWPSICASRAFWAVLFLARHLKVSETERDPQQTVQGRRAPPSSEGGSGASSVQHDSTRPFRFPPRCLKIDVCMASNRAPHSFTSFSFWPQVQSTSQLALKLMLLEWRIQVGSRCPGFLSPSFLEKCP